MEFLLCLQLRCYTAKTADKDNYLPAGIKGGDHQKIWRRLIERSMNKKHPLMKGLHVLFLFCLMTSAAACSTIAVETHYEPSVDFSRFKTYNWMSPSETSDNLQETIAAGRVGYLIEAAVERELAARGYEKEKRAGEKPDFFLAYRAHVDEKVKPEVITYSCAESICGQGIDLVRYREGTLVLDIIQADSNQVVWRGTAVSVIGDPSGRKQAIEAAVGQILKNFPPK
jgi:hypothetical protein